MLSGGTPGCAAPARSCPQLGLELILSKFQFGGRMPRPTGGKRFAWEHANPILSPFPIQTQPHPAAPLQPPFGENHHDSPKLPSTNPPPQAVTLHTQTPLPPPHAGCCRPDVTTPGCYEGKKPHTGLRSSTVPDPPAPRVGAESPSSSSGPSKSPCLSFPIAQVSPTELPAAARHYL